MSEPKSEIIPNENTIKEAICVRCLSETHGKSYNYTLKLMHVNLEDENRQHRLGEPLSPKRWYYHCSNCGFRTELPKSSLKKSYVTNSFAISKQKRIRKSATMTQEEFEEVSKIFGTETISKLDEDIRNPPQ